MTRIVIPNNLSSCLNKVSINLHIEERHAMWNWDEIKISKGSRKEEKRSRGREQRAREQERVCVREKESEEERKERERGGEKGERRWSNREKRATRFNSFYKFWNKHVSSLHTTSCRNKNHRTLAIYKEKEIMNNSYVSYEQTFYFTRTLCFDKRPSAQD